MKFLRMALFAALLSSGSLVSLYGMFPQFNIAIINSLCVPLEVNYCITGNQKISRVIVPGQVKIIGSEDIIMPDSMIAFSGYGVVNGYLVNTTELFHNVLRATWESLQPIKGDPLIITVSSKGLLAPSEVTFEFSKNLPGAIRESYDNIVKSGKGKPLAAFVPLSRYDLVEALTLKQLLRIRHSNQLNTVLVPARWWEWNSTTGEDAFRYILGLNKDYREADVKRAYSDIETEWDTGNIIGHEAQGYATTVISVAKQAHDLLLESLKDRGLMDEWQLLR